MGAGAQLKGKLREDTIADASFLRKVPGRGNAAPAIFTAQPSPAAARAPDALRTRVRHSIQIDFDQTLEGPLHLHRRQ